ncbi:LOW QUALITY PROTEIN: hypothetical protein ACHAWO_001780 [Cyclotella atomus]|uniref:Uncharacterized protein n=1 Tax=Cyclotella atomus TaxID=382360 RepID=A0ABD3P913_9STRA
MKETSSTKADIHATLQEIKEELHKDMAKATETVCKLGEENQKWMQQQNEKINDKLAEAEILVEIESEDGGPMVQELAAEVAAEAIRHAQRKLENFNAKTLEYEEELKANNKECKESLEKIRQYEE